MNNSYIACVAGKSGGHIIPCLTYARSIKHGDQKIIFFSNNTSLDYALLKDQHDIAHHYAYSLSITRTLWGICTTVISFIKTTLHAYKTLKKHRPSAIISTGGLISLPVCIAGWLLRIPCTLFELNAIPGKAARACAFFARTIHICFATAVSQFPAYKTTVMPYPLKPEIIQGACTKTVRNNNKKTVFIIGGSQGSISLNNAIKKMIERYSNVYDNITFIHQTGNNDQTDWPAWYANHSIDAIAFPFTDNLVPYYQQADIVITRAGAGTLFEIMAFKKKCFIIPLETKSTDHQVDNALAMQQQYPHLCTVIREKELCNDPEIMYKNII